MAEMISALFTRPGAERNRFERLAFGAPQAIWSARRPVDLRACLDEVEAQQLSGRYVIGVLSYEAAPAFDFAHQAHPPALLPLAWFAAYDKPVEWRSNTRDFTLGKPEVKTSRDDYHAAVKRVLEHIRAGDVYQVNYTVRAHCEFSGDALGAYEHLARVVPMPYSAYVNTGAVQIVSLSPELFLRRDGNMLTTSPMKGTAARKPSWDEDEHARMALEQSGKDRAENTMIVDLMRNDLGRVCYFGSVVVPELCKAYRYPTVHQMISTVQGELRSGVSMYEIFAATFPPGSVTGAPKIRALEVIRELESAPRGVYCGSVCLFYPKGDFVCSVAIRTLAIHGSIATLGIGSGIVIDSDPEREWDEVLLKSQFVMQRAKEFGLYEAFRWVPSVGYRNLHSHLRRLKHSCDYFARPFPVKEILRALRELKSTLGNQPNRIRLDVNGDDVRTTLLPEELGWPDNGVVVMIPHLRTDPTDPRLYHKTSTRPEKLAARERAKQLGAHEGLFLNLRGEFTEGTIANMMFRIGGQWITPALSCGLLPGVWRDNQIHSGRAREGIVTFADLRIVEEIVVGNSVRGEQRIVRIITEDGDEVYRDRSERS